MEQLPFVKTFFHFLKKSICDKFGNESRSGWYLQQLMKLYAGFYVPNIMNKYLVIDCDTFFLKPTRFIEPETGKCLYNHGSEHHGYYFDHMKKLDSGFRNVVSMLLQLSLLFP